jgi:taurine dioxygenase
VSSRIIATPLAPTVGVELSGLDLREPFTEQEAAELQDLMWRHSVLVFRDQQVAADDHIRLVELFGTVADELGDGSRHAYVSNVVDGAMLADGALLFHSDLTYTPAPYQILSLAAVELSGPVSPTRYASLAGGYDALPDELRERIADLTNTHVHWHLDGDDYVKTDLSATPDRAEYASVDQFPRNTWPVVHPHHRTGVPQLYVAQWFSHIDGMSDSDSEALLEELYGYLYDASNIYEHRWAEGDLVVWDNLAVQHGRPEFRGTGAVRTLRRVIATGDGRGMAETYELGGAAMPFAHAYGGRTE